MKVPYARHLQTNLFIVLSYSEDFPHSYFWYFDSINTMHSISLVSQLVSLSEKFYFQKPRLSPVSRPMSFKAKVEINNSY